LHPNEANESAWSILSGGAGVQTDKYCLHTLQVQELGMGIGIKIGIGIALHPERKIVVGYKKKSL